MIATPKISNICAAASKAELSGDYQSGLDELIEFWDYRHPNLPPQTDKLPDADAAELLLRAGALFGYYAVSNQEKQEISKNLLTSAFFKFKSLKNEAKQAECANYLAVAYWRMGNTGESKIWLAFGLERKLIDSIYLHTIIVESLIKLTDNNHLSVLGKFLDYTPYFEKTSNQFIKGVFYMNFGLAKKRFGAFEDSLEDFKTAIEIFRDLGNDLYHALVENNIAWLFKSQNMYEKALERGSTALKIAQRLGNLQRIGELYDTMAHISIDLNVAPLALNYAEKAVQSLEKTEAYGSLVEAYETKIRCHLKLNKVGDALLCYHEAMKIATEKTGPSVINRLIATATECFEKRHIVQLYREGGQLGFSDYYELIFPEDYNIEKDITTIECTTARLRHLGIDAGNIIVVEKTEVSDGDLVALTAKYGFSYVGFLEKRDHNILLRFKDGTDKKLRFHERDIKYLGRVVGVCPDVAEEWPVLQVQMLDL